MGSGTQWVTGSFLSTGALQNIDTVGFSPRIVELRKVTGTIGSMTWDDSMPEGSGYKQVGGTSTAPSSGCITPRSKGFSLGVDAMNTDGDTWHWRAAR